MINLCLSCNMQELKAGLIQKRVCVRQQFRQSWRCEHMDATACGVCNVCAFACVRVHLPPLLKYFSHSRSIPNGTAGEQKPDQNAACASLNRLAASEGLSVTTAFPVSSNRHCSSFTVFIKMI